MPEKNTSAGVQRRTVVAGAAWTIPVVATAVGAPLAAASTTPPPRTPQYTVSFTGATSLTPGVVTRNSAFDSTVAVRVTGPDNAEWVEVQAFVQSTAHNPQGPVLRGGPVAPYGFTLVRTYQQNSPGGYVDNYHYRAYNVPPGEFNFTFRSFVNSATGPGYLRVGFGLYAPSGHGGGGIASPMVPVIV